MSRARLVPFLIFLSCAVALQILTMWLMGRVWWCGCNEFFIASWSIWSRHNSQHLIDPYSFSHLSHGLIFFLFLRWWGPRANVDLKLAIACTIEIVWEIAENTSFIIERYRSVTISLDYFGDSIANSVADLICCLAGYLLAQALGVRRTILLFIMIEIVLLLTIRDSLTINVIMLLWPLQSILRWQQAGLLELGTMLMPT